MNKTLEEALKFCKFDGFTSISDIIETFRLKEDAFNNCTVLYARCNEYCYEGEATVRYYNHIDSKFYESNSYHCSCYGFEDSFSPEEIGDLEMYIKYCEYRNLDY